MNRHSTIILLLLALGIASAATACADDDDQQNDPTSQSSEISEIDRKAAEARQTPTPVDPNTIAGQTSLVKSCENCGPLPDPWAKGPLPDPWKQTSSSSGTTTGSGTDATGHK